MKTILIALMGTLMLLSGTLTANEINPVATSAQLRFGDITTEPRIGACENTLAMGGRFGLLMPVSDEVGAGVSFYSTNALLGEDDNRYFLDAQNNGYALAGEAWLSLDVGKTQLKAGRQLVDTPFVDTDDTGMILNSFEGVVATSTDLDKVTLMALHLRKWASRDNESPEKFEDINRDKGISGLGMSYAVSDAVSLQAWHYQATDLASMTYIEAGLESEAFNLAIQYTTQGDETGDDSGLDGDAWGVMADYSLAGFTFSGAYNRASGAVGNGFGGGPYFTSTEDHTIDGVDDERATMLGLDYVGFGPLTLLVLSTDFDKSEDEADWIASYSFNNSVSADIVFSDMGDDGKMTKVFVNYDF
ncbi:MAG: hypothetical protein DSZ28_03090 [Thiothrix sp.]|nr:MAG: hypothetical protein DSZ28_03090 [Thiothrix sp.]